MLRRDGMPAHWSDEALHRAAFASDPELYTLCAFLEGIQQCQQSRILLLLLTESRRDLTPALRAHQEAISLFLLSTLPVELVLNVFLAVRRARANHRHTTRAILSYLLQHPEFEALVCARPRAVRDCLEHALGKSRARYFGYHAPRRGQDTCTPSVLRRVGRSESEIRRLLLLLYFGEKRRDAPRTDAAKPVREIVAADVMTPLLLQFYRVGTSRDLVEQLEASIVALSSRLPELTGKIALILDASASMRGSGAHPFAPIALAVAFERILAVKCPDLRPFTIGGFGSPPAPEGPTDFGRALIDALEGEPELIVFVTDGYENLDEGDAARILATLRTLGLTVPIVCCRIETDENGFGYNRQSGNDVPEFPLRNEFDFDVAVQILDLLVAPQAARERIVNALRARQARWEEETYAWTVAS